MIRSSCGSWLVAGPVAAILRYLWLPTLGGGGLGFLAAWLMYETEAYPRRWYGVAFAFPWAATRCGGCPGVIG